MQNLTEILTDIQEGIDGEEISLREIVVRFEDRGFGPLLLAPALLAVLPTGAIPGVPSICAIFILLISGQILFGKRHPWLPQRIRRFSFSKSKFEQGFQHMKPWTKRFDRLLSPRLEFLTGEIGTRLVALIAIALALIMIPLELIPGACAAPGIAIGLFAISLSARDGLFALFALLFASGAAVLAIHLWPF
ncbi:MAG: exopolysaccharide biosynthesis protein [Verrucomicrobiota bacterium]